MFDFLESLFDPNHDFNRGTEAGRDAGFLEDLLHDVIPFGSKAFDAGYEKGRSERDQD